MSSPYQRGVARGEVHDADRAEPRMSAASDADTAPSADPKPTAMAKANGFIDVRMIGAPPDD